jgi:hypothetical protein
MSEKQRPEPEPGSNEWGAERRLKRVDQLGSAAFSNNSGLQFNTRGAQNNNTSSGSQFVGSIFQGPITFNQNDGKTAL